MTSRDPMFGKVVKPYADGTGNSQSGPSADRQEREDEKGISKARQTLALGFLEREATLGITYRELCKLTGWVGGQATGALSALDTAGEVVRLEEQREHQSVYVLEQFRSGRARARKRKSTADRVRERAAERITELEGELRLVKTQFEELRAAAQIRPTEAALTQRVAELEAALSRSQNESRLATSRLEQLEAEFSDNALMRANEALRISALLREKLEDDEIEVILRVAEKLGLVSVQALTDESEVKVTLGVLRTLMRVVGRATRFSPSSH